MNTSTTGFFPSQTPVPIHLTRFEGNALGAAYEQYTRVGHDGTGIYDAVLNARVIELEIGMIAKNGTEAAMYELRRTALSCFPPGTQGKMTYKNDAGEYEIECYVNEYPGCEHICGVLCTTKLYFTAPLPFWRKKADDITLRCTAADLYETEVFSAATQYPVPAMFNIECTEMISQAEGERRPPALITLSGTNRQRDFSRMGINTKTPQTASKTVTKSLYLTTDLEAETLTVDWGLLNRFYITPGRLDCVDFIRSGAQYVYPGENTLTVGINGIAGELDVRLLRFDYVRAV